MWTIYRYFRWLSLDIVLGAIFFLAYLEKFYQVEITIAMYSALASAIWLIYTADHLIDSLKVLLPSSDRHIFHKCHFNILVLISGCVLIVALINVSFLPEDLIKNGAMLAAACIGYLLLVFFVKQLFVKEVFVAIAYGGGIFLAPVTMVPDFGFADAILCGQLILIALINLLVFSYYDQSSDLEDGFWSLVIRLGPKKTAVLIHFIGILSITMSLFLFITSGLFLQLLYLFMSLVLYGLFLFPVVAINDRFRMIGDGIFCLPILFLW